MSNSRISTIGGTIMIAVCVASTASAEDQPQSPLVVLFEDEAAVVPALNQGKGRISLDSNDRHSGSASLVVTPPQRFSENIKGWKYRIREKPQAGDFRYLRFAWKKRGGGGVMLELANSGKWPGVKQPKGRYVAGANTTGWVAISVGDDAPTNWTVVTRDLWKDLGDWTLTGIAPTCIDGEAALFDQLLLGPTLKSLDAYQPGTATLALADAPTANPAPAKPTGSTTPPPTVPAKRIGDAWTDKQNPVVQRFDGERLDLWSLRKPQRSGLPKVRDEQWVRNPIDRFVLAKLEAKKLQPSPIADRRTLIRRLYFDLLGLPPAPADVGRFEADRSPDAWKNLVDRVLGSKRYGERWARHWMDVVRYADTQGYERDEFRPNTFRFRDYLIRSFNEDKPYDQFVREQLAGDEMVIRPLDDAATQMLIATGFLRLGQHDSTASIFDENKRSRDALLADLVNTTSSAFLGLTMACCRCHDHKYDPFLQTDHFRMRAFFAAVKFRDDLVVDTAARQAEINTHNAAVDKQVASITSEIAKLVKASTDRIAAARTNAFPTDIQQLLRSDEKARADATKKKLKPFLDKLKVSEKDAVAGFAGNEKTRHTALTKQVAELKSTKLAFTHAMGMTDSGSSAPATHLFSQGDYTQPLATVEPGYFAVYDPSRAAVEKPPVPNSSGRRTALANWIVSPENPWTARVIVNRIWLRHFAKGIVETPNDFGYSGARPTHPRLLDWLAIKFMENSWSVKSLHRLILNSATYRQASVIDPAKARIDDANELLWRQNIRRLEAEMLRDAMLAVSGRLLPYDHGRPMWPPVPEELLNAQPSILEAKKGGDGGRRQGWYADAVEETDVRSVFLIQKRSLPLPFLQTFDLPEINTSCSRRGVTTVAPQALTLLNSPFAVRMSKSFAVRVAKEAGNSPQEQVAQAFRLALQRQPGTDDLQIGLDVLTRHTLRYRNAKRASPEQAALIDLCRTLLNVNEFVYVD